MEKQNNGQFFKRTEEIEINLADLLLEFCLQWKKAVICAAVFAVLFGGYGWVKNSQNTSGAQKPVRTELTEEERQSVMEAAELAEEIGNLEEYLENSILMQADSYHKNKAVMLFSVEQAKYQELQKIIESYLSFVVNGGAAEVLHKSGGWEMDKEYLAEMLTAYQRSYSLPYQIASDGESEKNLTATGLFYVEVTGKDAQMADRMLLDMQDALKEYAAEVKHQAGTHRLKLLSSEKSVAADSGLLAQQNDKKGLFASSVSNLKGLTDSFSDAQMTEYEKISSRKNAGVRPKEEENGKKADEGRGISGIPVKYFCFGAAGGIFIYCCIFACQYLLRNTVRSAEEIKRIYALPFYGSVILKNQRKKPGRVCTGEQQNRSLQEEKKLVNRIRFACKNQGITKLCIAAGFLPEEQEKECIQRIAGQLKNQGIDAVFMENASEDAAVWDTLAEMRNVLMVLKIGTTAYRTLDEELCFYLENEIAVAGIMAFAER